MDAKQINRIFYRDGYQLAHAHLSEGFSAAGIRAAVGQLYSSVDGLLEAFLRRASEEGSPAHCRRGCSWCCHQAVFAVTHEFLVLREYVVAHSSPEEASGYLARAEKKSGITTPKALRELLRHRAPCPFLDNGICGVYAARPMACRIYLSSSEAACRLDFQDPGDEKQFPGLFDFPLQAGRMLNEGFVAYLKQNGLQSTELPLEQGYASMMQADMTLEGWLSNRSNSA